jgi:ureidoacrylate peracid hydrolase
MRVPPQASYLKAVSSAGRPPGDKGVSFVRARKPQRIVIFGSGPDSVEVDLASAALIVVDMQNDFLHPEGWFASRGIDAAPVRAVIPAIETLTAAMRVADVPVIWLNWGVRPDRANLPPHTINRGRSGGAVTYADPSPSGRGGVLVRDAWGAAIVDDLTVANDDLIIHKHRLSGFWDNELDSVLRQRHITTLLFAGINIDRCVFSTLQDANFLGYDCLLVEDACATVSPDFVRDAIVFLVRKLHGAVTTSSAIFTAIGLPDPAPSSKDTANPDRSAP